MACSRRAVDGGRGELASEDFFHVADFIADGAFDFVSGAAVLEIAVAGGAAGFFFHDAFGLLDAAFDFILGARFHTN